MTKIYVCAMMRNESKYLNEWLNYHHFFGVDGIILYDNNIDMEEREKCRKIVDKFDNVILKNWDDYNNISRFLGVHFRSDSYLGVKARYHGMNKQQFAYNDALEYCRKNNIDYLIKFDIDEFLVGDIEKLKENLKGNTKVRRYDFGSNGHEKKPEGFVIDNYTKREKKSSHIKEIANVNKTKSTGYSSHTWETKNDRYFFTFSCIFLLSSLPLLFLKKYKLVFLVLFLSIICYLIFLQPNNRYAEDVELMHYYTKSKEEFLGRLTCSCDGRKNIPRFFKFDHKETEDKRVIDNLDKWRDKFK